MLMGAGAWVEASSPHPLLPRLGIFIHLRVRWLAWEWGSYATVLSQWLMHRRRLANGISAAGSGIGGLTFSLVSSAMIENISLEWSLCIISILTDIANTLAATFILDHNATI